MNNKLWRVPIVFIITGIILTIFSHILIFVMLSWTNIFNEQTINSYNIIIFIPTVIVFIVTCLLYFRDMTTKDIIRSASIISIYHVIIFMIQQISQATGFLFYFYTLVHSILYIPLTMSTNFHLFLVTLTDWNLYLSSIPIFFLPFLYVLFAKKIK